MTNTIEEAAGQMDQGEVKIWHNLMKQTELSNLFKESSDGAQAPFKTALRELREMIKKIEHGSAGDNTENCYPWIDKKQSIAAA
jgi:hypothetical protein